ncbi:MAG: hypothetical protein MUO41_02765 [Methyloceanibacter sp.]|nr:hypothetical protein [Methyloceanibacter sp.]
MIDEQSPTSVPKLCPACHQALEKHFDAILATVAASHAPSGTMVQQQLLLFKHYILDRHLLGNSEFMAALLALDKEEEGSR